MRLSAGSSKKRSIPIQEKKVKPITSSRKCIIEKNFKVESESSQTHCYARTEKAQLKFEKQKPKQRIKIEPHTIKSKKRNCDSRVRVKHETVIRPTHDEIRYTTSTLGLLHPSVLDHNCERRTTLLESCGLRDSITDSVVSTMLSQNTTDANSKAAYKNLKKHFPTWDSVAECHNIRKIEDAIRVAGLAKTRAERIRTMLRIVKDERGCASLDYISKLDDYGVKKELSRFKGLGPKTISCVLLFALGRPEFPVDTHVLRISQKMGWVGSSASREGAYDYLNRTIPDDVKMNLHCLLVFHGKICHRCAANGRPQFPPKDGKRLSCPLVNVNKWGGNIPKEMNFRDPRNRSHSLLKEKSQIIKPDPIKSEHMS